jgi:hypothetical protein
VFDGVALQGIGPGEAENCKSISSEMLGQIIGERLGPDSISGEGQRSSPVPQVPMRGSATVALKSQTLEALSAQFCEPIRLAQLTQD